MMLVCTIKLLRRHCCEKTIIHSKPNTILSEVHGICFLLLLKQLHSLIIAVSFLRTGSRAILIVIAIFWRWLAVINTPIRRLLKLDITTCDHAFIRAPMFFMLGFISFVKFYCFAATVADLLSICFDSTRIRAIDSHFLIHRCIRLPWLKSIMLLNSNFRCLFIWSQMSLFFVLMTRCSLIRT